MFFLIGVIILIVFIVSTYIYFTGRVRQVFGSDLLTLIKQARLEDEVLPKSLSSMDSIYLENIRRDYPDVNIPEFKRKSEKYILDYLHAVEKKNTSDLKGKLKSLAEAAIEDLNGKEVKFDDIKFHNRVLDRYRKESGLAIITIGCSFEYIKKYDGKEKKIQDRARVEYIFVSEYEKVDNTKKQFAINCPNCGSPYINQANKECSYCGTLVYPIIKNSWVLNDVTFY